MEYSEAIHTFFSRLPMFSNTGKKALKPKLDNILKLITLLNLDIHSIPYIHVAGTNGKGSTCHILAATLQKAGYKTGLLTSPHLVDLRERVKIDGKPIAEEYVIDFVKKMQTVTEDIEASYFEMNVALAFYCFVKEKVDVAVLETGLGGRWDSTNIITPIVSVITSIDFDHTDILGDTLEAIAYEKAGIIKPNVPVLIGKKHPETDKVFNQTALIQNATIFYAEDFFTPVSLSDLPENNVMFQFKYFFDLQRHEKYLLQTDLMGDFQWKNIRTAWSTIRILKQLGWKTTDDVFLSALQTVKSTTQLRGRWDFYSSQIILDVGHNPDGIATVVRNLQRIPKKLKIVYGSVRDKDVNHCVQLLPENATYFLTQAHVPRALPVDELSSIFLINNKNHFYTFPNVKEAVKNAIENLQNDELLMITGSFFIVGEAYQYLDSVKC